MTRDELAQLMLGDYQQITADEAQRAPITPQPVMGDLAAQAPSPHEIAAARVQRSVQPLGGRLEGAATELPWKLMTDPLKKAQGFIQAGMNTEQFPLQTMAPGSVLNISTDYDPRRRMGDLAAETALNVTGMPMFGTAPAGSLGMSAARQAPGALAEQAPPFYSAVEQAVQASKQSAAPGQQWAGTLRNTPGVKPEEIETLGLGKLFEQPGSVPKQAVLDQIAANKVNVGEVVKGAAKPMTDAEVRKYHDISAGTWREASDLEREAMRTEAMGFENRTPTKFSQYTLPGGENYREMLLTLPQKKEPSGRLVVTDGSNFNMAVNTRTEADDIIRNMQPHSNVPLRVIEERKPSADNFTSSHYDEPNILAHVRYNDRVIDGKKTLFVEEVQSDWHQAGKKRGYKGDDPQPLIERAEAARQAVSNRYEELPALASDGKYKTKREILDAGDNAVFSKYQRLLREDQQTGRLAELDRAHDAAVSALNRAREGVPDAPFKTTWPDLAMKRIIREAAEKGYDKVAWTPGSVQADRYDLSKHIKEVKFEKAGTGGFDRLDDIDAGTFGTLIARDHNGKEVMRQHMDAKELPDHIGKDVADKLLGQKPAAENRSGMALASRSLSGLDLKVGGEGMKGFYDEILPATVNKLVKKHGGRVGQGGITTEPHVASIEEYARRIGLPVDSQTVQTEYPKSVARAATKVHTLDITPQLRKHALEKGFPYFTVGGTGVLGGLAAQDQYQRQGGM